MKNNVGKSVGWKETFNILLITIVLSYAYVFYKYIIIRGASYDNLPLYLTNKVLAVASVILIGLSFIMGPLARFSKSMVPHLYLRKHLGLVGFAVAALHAFISTMLLSQAYYGRFYAASGKMTLTGEGSMLFGVLAIFVFAGISITSLPPIANHMDGRQWQFVQRLGYLAYILVLLHVYIMGGSNWFNPSKYPNDLWSIGLIAALAIILVLVMRVLVMVLPPKRR